VVSGLQKHVEVDEPEEDEIDLMAGRDLLLDAGGESVLDSEDGDDGLTIHEDGAEMDAGVFDDE